MSSELVVPDRNTLPSVRVSLNSTAESEDSSVIVISTEVGLKCFKLLNQAQEVVSNSTDAVITPDIFPAPS